MYSPILQGSVQHHNSDFRTVLTNANQGYGLDRRVSVPWAFKLDFLQPVKPILYPKFFNFFTFTQAPQNTIS